MNNALLSVSICDRCECFHIYLPVLDNLPLIPWAFKASEIFVFTLMGICFCIFVFHRHRMVMRRVFCVMTCAKHQTIFVRFRFCCDASRLSREFFFSWDAWRCWGHHSVYLVHTWNAALHPPVAWKRSSKEPSKSPLVLARLSPGYRHVATTCFQVHQRNQQANVLPTTAHFRIVLMRHANSLRRILCPKYSVAATYALHSSQDSCSPWSSSSTLNLTLAGHTIMLTVLNAFAERYTPFDWKILHLITWILNLFGCFLILAAHEHYTIDVVIAFFLSKTIFHGYHDSAALQTIIINEGDRHASGNEAQAFFWSW